MNQLPNCLQYIKYLVFYFLGLLCLELSPIIFSFYNLPLPISTRTLFIISLINALLAAPILARRKGVVESIGGKLIVANTLYWPFFFFAAYPFTSLDILLSVLLIVVGISIPLWSKKITLWLYSWGVLGSNSSEEYRWLVKEGAKPQNNRLTAVLFEVALFLGSLTYFITRVLGVIKGNNFGFILSLGILKPVFLFEIFGLGLPIGLSIKIRLLSKKRKEDESEKPNSTVEESNKNNGINFIKIGFWLEFVLVIIFLILGYGYFIDFEKKKLLIEEQKGQKSFKKTLKVSSWKEFNDPGYPFTFKYPEDWFVQFAWDGREVLVSNYPESKLGEVSGKICPKCTKEEKENYYAFAVMDNGDSSKEENTNNPLIYYLKVMLAEEEQCETEKRNTGKEYCSPKIPGAPRTISYAGSLVTDLSISIVEVPLLYTPLPTRCVGSDCIIDGEEELSGGCPGYGLLAKEFRVIKNFSLYSVSLVGPPEYQCSNNGEFGESHPLTQIFKTLKFK